MAWIGAGLAVAIVALELVVHHRPPAPPPVVRVGVAYHGPYAPVTASSSGTVTMAQPGVTRPELDVYEDFQCPPCRAFEKASGGVIQQLADQGRLKVVYHPFTIFVAQPQQANSTRAWVASRCAPAQNWVAYHNALFASQPALTTVNGFPVTQLLQLGKKSGITDQAFTQCVSSQKDATQDASLSHTTLALGSGLDGLPTLKLNGTILTASPTSSTFRSQLIAAAP